VTAGSWQPDKPGSWQQVMGAKDVPDFKTMCSVNEAESFVIVRENDGQIGLSRDGYSSALMRTVE
jgi:hypothetical protein